MGRYLKDSLILVAGTVFLSIAAGVSCAWLVTCCEFPGRRIFEWALVLPLAVPTFIAAYAYFDLLDMLTPLLIWVRINVGPDVMIFLSDFLVYPVTALVMASVLYPYVYLLARASFSRQGGQLIEAAQTLGYNPKSIFFRCRPWPGPLSWLEPAWSSWKRSTTTGRSRFRPPLYDRNFPNLVRLERHGQRPPGRHAHALHPVPAFP